MESILKACTRRGEVTDASSPCEEWLAILKTWRVLAINHKFSYFQDETEQNKTEPFFFVQGTDIQFGLIQQMIEKNTVPNWDREIELAEVAVMKINRMKPKPRFFVMCGDMLNATPNDEPDVRHQQEVDFKKIFLKLDRSIPLVCACGNHDIGDHPTKESITVFRETFGDDYFSFWCNSVFFIVINTQYYHDKRGVNDWALEHDKWLDRTLETARKSGKRSIVLQHIPWFLRKADEIDLTEYYSIADPLRKKMLDKFQRAGVQCIFAGHYHRNSMGVYKNMEMVVTSSMGGQLGFDMPGLRVVRCLEHEIHHTYYSLDNFPRVVDL